MLTSYSTTLDSWVLVCLVIGLEFLSLALLTRCVQRYPNRWGPVAWCVLAWLGVMVTLFLVSQGLMREGWLGDGWGAIKLSATPYALHETKMLSHGVACSALVFWPVGAWFWVWQNRSCAPSFVKARRWVALRSGMGRARSVAAHFGA